MKFKFSPIALIIFQLLFCYFENHEQQNQLVIKNLIGNNVNIDSLDQFIEDKMNSLQVPGLSMAIINDGKVVYNMVKGFADVENSKPVTDNTLFEGASLSKPLFAYFTMIAIDEGILDLDEPLHKYLPFPEISDDPRHKKLTARRVLSHSTGLPNWRSKTEPLELNFTPGSSFEYSGEGYQYLAKVLMHLYKTDDMGLEELFQKKVAFPLNLKHTKFIQDPSDLNHLVLPHKNGKRIHGEEDPEEFGSAYSVHSEAVDYASFLIALMQEKGLSAKSFDDMFDIQINLPPDNPRHQQGVTGWTLGFANAQLPFGQLFAHGGNNVGFSSLTALNLDKEWGFVIFANADQSLIGLETILYINSF